VFREVLTAGPAQRPARRNLVDAVTVFAITTGASSFEVCRQHLDTQDCAFRLEIIDRVAPMSAALQRMLETCVTPYLVQVDENMLLYPHAVRTLYELLSGAAADVAMVAADLHDVHLGRPVQGVTMSRHAIAARYPFEGVGEKHRVQRMQADGYAVQDVPKGVMDPANPVLGLYGAHAKPRFLYERYIELERQRRDHPLDLAWFEAYPTVFLDRFLEEPSDINFYAVMGVMAGALARASGRGPDDDTDQRSSDPRPGFDSLRQFLDDWSGPGSDAPSLSESIPIDADRVEGTGPARVLDAGRAILKRLLVRWGLRIE
jgi:hypothetical protein